MTKSNRKQFTLIEVLVVVAIIGILASLLLPVLGKARKTSRAALSINNLKQIHLATIIYADNNNDVLFISDSNSHPRNNNDDTYWARMAYESSFGIFSLDNNDAQAEMASSSYNSMMFCPLLLAERDPIEHNASGRSSYSINRYFGRDQNDFTLNNLEGKIEPFIVPGTPTSNNKAHASTNLKHTEFSLNSNRPAYEYNDKTLTLFLAGQVTYMTIGQGSQIQDLVNDNIDFQ